MREAIKSLEAMGIVQSIQGSGSYITNTPEQSINRPLCALFALSNGTLENVLDLRNVLETDVCRDIIRTASDDEIARLCALGDLLHLDRELLGRRKDVAELEREVVIIVRAGLIAAAAGAQCKHHGQGEKHRNNFFQGSSFLLKKALNFSPSF